MHGETLKLSQPVYRDRNLDTFSPEKLSYWSSKHQIRSWTLFSQLQAVRNSSAAVSVAREAWVTINPKCL